MSGGGLRQLLLRQITGDEQMGGMLAGYNKAPAVFYQKAPSDSRPGWGSPKYPRLDFNVDMRHDPERKTEGTLTVNIWCTSECPAVGDLDPDRAIEQRLLELVSGVFYTDGNRETFCAEWERSDEFLYEKGEKSDNTFPEVYGLTVTFSLMAFPEQITTSPDPIQGLNAWTRKHFPKMMVIAYDDMPPMWKPSDDNPAIYWRFTGTSSSNRQSSAVTWYTGTFAAHIIAESVTERNKWTKAVIEQAQMEGEVILPDTSPMFINRIAVRHNADHLQDGQLELTGQYGVLHVEDARIRLFHPRHNWANEYKPQQQKEG